MDEKFLNFRQIQERAIESKNKVAFLVTTFRVLHDDALPEDLNSNLGGRLGFILKLANSDYVRVLQAMWMASAIGIRGSHLNYIQRMIEGKREAHKKTKPLARVSVSDLANRDRNATN